MKRVNAVVGAWTLAVSVVALSHPASAGTYAGTGTVNFLEVASSSVGVDQDYFMLNGVTALGTCPAQNGLVVFRLLGDVKGQRQVALIVSAKLAGITLTATVEDSHVDAQGFCYIQWVTF